MRLRYYNSKTNDIYKFYIQYLQIRNNTVAVIFYTLTLKSKWKVVGFCLHSKFPISPKIPGLFTKVSVFFPGFQKLWVFCNSTLEKEIRQKLYRHWFDVTSTFQTSGGIIWNYSDTTGGLWCKKPASIKKPATGHTS